MLLAFLAVVLCDLLIPITASNFRSHIATRWIGLTLLAGTSLTDLFDGMMARKWDVVTRFGAVCDPLMDKFFFAVVFPTVTALFFLAGDIILGSLSLAFSVLHLMRDMWVVTLRSLAAGKADLKADFIGKLRTAISFPIGIVAYCRVALASEIRWMESQSATALLVALFAIGLAVNAYSVFSYTARFRFAIADALRPEGAAGK